MATYMFMRKKRSLSKRLARLIYFIGSVLLIYKFYPKLNYNRIEDVEYGHRLVAKLNDSKNNFYAPNQACRFPILNPFDSSIMKFVQHPKPLNCVKHQPEFTFVQGNEVIFDTNLGEQHNLNGLQFRYFRKANGSDASVFYEKWKSFPKSGKLSLNSWSGVSIKGSYDKNSTYANIYPSIEPLYGLTKNKIDPVYRPNVLIIGIDSVSRSNFIRNLPLTYKYLTDIVGGWDMRGYVKIDDNTFPNMAAVLTGHKATVQKSEFFENPQREFVDNWPFIWKNFSNVGFTTMLAEEQPGIFSYKAPGFKKQPTNVYLRSYAKLLTDEPSYEPYCFSDKPEALLILESIERFMESQTLMTNPYFVFSFLWKLSHDLTYQIERLDKILSTWFEKIHRKNLLRNTLIFVTSDHGNRFDDIRSTLIGRYEERMPFLFLRPPEIMLGKFPEIEKKLTNNLFRMTCHYDFYETLVDVVKGDYGNPNRPRLRNRGYSLFRDVPKERTCADIDVEEHFCVCQTEKQLNIDDSLAITSSKAILAEINKNLDPVKEKCLPVSLSKILSAEKLTANNKVRDNNRYHFDKLLSDKNVTNLISFVRITMKTDPGNGIFEGVVQITQASGEDSNIISAVTGYENISRINSYGQSANCVSMTHRFLEKFCTCKESFL